MSFVLKWLGGKGSQSLSQTVDMTAVSYHNHISADGYLKLKRKGDQHNFGCTPIRGSHDEPNPDYIRLRTNFSWIPHQTEPFRHIKENHGPLSLT